MLPARRQHCVFSPSTLSVGLLLMTSVGGMCVGGTGQGAKQIQAFPSAHAEHLLVKVGITPLWVLHLVRKLRLPVGISNLSSSHSPHPTSCLPIHPCIHPSFLSFHPSTQLSICLSTHQPSHPSILHPSIHTSIYSSILPSFLFPSVCSSFHISICLT